MHKLSQAKGFPGEQIMAPLPSARVAPTDPLFTHVGVDYFGPLCVKQGHSRVKCYGCLFAFLTMRAVHIEVVLTLEADSFICAYQRFVGHTGKPKEIYSDSGTNFTVSERSTGATGPSQNLQLSKVEQRSEVI